MRGPVPSKWLWSGGRHWVDAGAFPAKPLQGRLKELQRCLATTVLERKALVERVQHQLCKVAGGGWTVSQIFGTRYVVFMQPQLGPYNQEIQTLESDMCSLTSKAGELDSRTSASAPVLGEGTFSFFFGFLPALIDASAEDVQMASLRIVPPGCEVWDHFVREFRRRYNTMMTWDEFRSFVSRTKSYHVIGELPSESDESVQPQWGTYDPYQQGYWGY
ncbi:hypothetical protein Taro_054931 [Colocasia esculenta]|uniref:Uncharacterized protein n=1 Tax=Colocasia esculenta TaxID=4460 RepID=A0A843XSP0_COLES|nr:hypothetical protein [Colocasia esculenta]